MRRRFGITNKPGTSQEESKQRNPKNNDGDDSDSDESYYAELERLKKLQAEKEVIGGPGLNAPNRRFVP